jgi:antitoxin HicB
MKLKSSATRYTVSDGKLVLYLEPDPDGGFVVTSPLDPEMVTEAESVPEAFAMARDALKELRLARAKLMRRFAAMAK